MRHTDLPWPSHIFGEHVGDCNMAIDGDLDTPHIVRAGGVAGIGSQNGRRLVP